MADEPLSGSSPETAKISASLVAEPRNDLFLALGALLLIAACFTRFYDLGAKPPHHDESMHAYYSSLLEQNWDYRYDPMMHGPFQFHGNALMFHLFGISTAVSRYLAGLCGVLTVALVLMMAPFVGRGPSLLGAALIVFSPACMYFSRFCREDIYAVAGTMALVVFLFRYVRSQRPHELWLAALGFSVAYCSKETTFLTLAIFAGYLIFRLMIPTQQQPRSRPAPMGSLENFFSRIEMDEFFPTLLGAVLIFGILFVLFFTTFFHVGSGEPAITRIPTFLNCLYKGIFGAVGYWMAQHNVHRGDQPWYYYFLQLLANEPAAFFFGFVAVIYYFGFNRRPVCLFLASWFLGALVLFSWAGEKMPWLTIHILIPGLLLTGCFVFDLWEIAISSPSKKIVAFAGLFFFGILSIYSAFSSVRLSFDNAANPVEPYVYVQSSPDCLEVEKIIRKVSYGETGGPDMSLTIHDKCSWPFAWQLRDFTKRNHLAEIKMADSPIILSATDSDDQIYPVLSKAGYVSRKYKLRTWWLISWFKRGDGGQPMTLGLFPKWLFGNLMPVSTPIPDMVNWNDLGRWILYRQPWSELGSYDMRLWIRDDLAKKYGFEGTDSKSI